MIGTRSRGSLAASWEKYSCVKSIFNYMLRFSDCWKHTAFRFSKLVRNFQIIQFPNMLDRSSVALYGIVRLSVWCNMVAFLQAQKSDVHEQCSNGKLSCHKKPKNDTTMLLLLLCFQTLVSAHLKSPIPWKQVLLFYKCQHNNDTLHAIFKFSTKKKNPTEPTTAHGFKVLIMGPSDIFGFQDRRSPLDCRPQPTTVRLRNEETAVVDRQPGGEAQDGTQTPWLHHGESWEVFQFFVGAFRIYTLSRVIHICWKHLSGTSSKCLGSEVWFVKRSSLFQINWITCWIGSRITCASTVRLSWNIGAFHPSFLVRLVDGSEIRRL